MRTGKLWIAAAVVVTLFFTFRLDRIKAQSGTALGNLAGSMQPGTWAQLPQTNINAALGRGGVVGNQLPYAVAMAWDPVRQKLTFAGADHGESAVNYMSYDAAGNSWTFGGGTPLTLSHGYDHNTLDPNTGILYVREFGIATGGNRIWQLPPGGSWSVRTSWTPTQ